MNLNKDYFYNIFELLLGTSIKKNIKIYTTYCILIVITRKNMFMCVKLIYLITILFLIQKGILLRIKIN